jgi:hypothetical protein
VSIFDGLSTTRQGDALDTYIVDFNTQTQRALTSGNSGGAADWWAGSDSVVYVDNTRRLQRDIRVLVRAADGSGSARELFRSPMGIHDIEVSPDGNRMVYATGLSSTGATVIEVRDLKTGTMTRISDDAPAIRRRPTFSSDGMRVLYDDESWTTVLSADGTGVSARHGTRQFAAWDPTTDRIFGYGPVTMSVYVNHGTPDLLAVRAPGRVMALDVFPGGSQMLVAAESTDEQESESAGDSETIRTIFMVLNLFEELK